MWHSILLSWQCIDCRGSLLFSIANNNRNYDGKTMLLHSAVVVLPYYYIYLVLNHNTHHDVLLFVDDDDGNKIK